MPRRSLFCTLFALGVATLAPGQDEAAPKPLQPEGLSFAAFLHKSTQGRDREVSLWEVPIGTAAKRRQTLGKSPWNATPLADSPRLLRWQVRVDGQRHYSVRILHIDFAKFEAKELLQAKQAFGRGEWGDLVYVDMPEGLHVLDARKGTAEDLPIRFDVLSKHDHRWLVQTDGHVAIFDAAQSRIERSYKSIDAIPREKLRGTKWNGGRFAVRSGAFYQGGQEVMVLDFGQTSVIREELHICDLDTGEESTIRRRTLATGGSGVGVIPVGLPTELVGGMFRYVELNSDDVENNGRDLDLEGHSEWVTIDIGSGKELLRKAYEPRQLKDLDPLDERRVPGYLRPAFTGSDRWPDTADIAYEFLLLHKINALRIRATCRSTDGRHILALDGDTLHYCDLETQATWSWAAPKEWARVVGVTLHAVDAE